MPVHTSPMSTVPGAGPLGSAAPSRPASAAVGFRTPERSPWRRAVGIGLVILVVGAVAVLGYMVVRLQFLVGDLDAQLIDANAQTEQAQRDVAELRHKLDETQQSIGQVQDDIGTTQGQIGQQQQQLDQVDKAAQSGQPDVNAIAQAATPSTVTIRTGRAEGSGFVIDGVTLPSGMGSAIVTNHHVIEAGDASRIVVRQNGQTYKGTVGQLDKENDLALVFIKEKLPPMKWASRNGHTVKLGDFVVAIGTPFGQENTVTTGNISHLDGERIQSTATLNPGNSGGPLLNAFGEVVGVNASKIDTAEGMNFSIPVERLCDSLANC